MSLFLLLSTISTSSCNIYNNRKHLQTIIAKRNFFSIAKHQFVCVCVCVCVFQYHVMLYQGFQFNSHAHKLQCPVYTQFTDINSYIQFLRFSLQVKVHLVAVIKGLATLHQRIEVVHVGYIICTCTCIRVGNKSQCYGEHWCSP